MKRNILIGIFLVLVMTGFSQKISKKCFLDHITPVCRVSNEVHRTYVKPPFLVKSSGQPNANIIVVYDDEFEKDDQAKAAFEAAVAIWEELIYSPVPIYVYAYWDKLEEGVLGSCTPWDFFANMDCMPEKDTYYPVAIAEKMLGKEISDGSTPDIYARFNSDFDWYFGTDGNTPTKKIDFMSVVLHELGHGLGYTGMGSINSVIKTGGFAFSEPNPGIFDRYIVNAKQEYLTDTSLFANPSKNLYTQFQSGFLYFHGAIPYEDYGKDEYPRLYAPFSFDQGSSIYHLNENTYNAGDINSLMTPQIGYSEAIHNPGSLSLGMLFQMGWKFTRIKHEQVPDIEKLEDLKKVEASIDSDYELDSTSVFLIASQDDFVTVDSILMTANETTTNFEAALPMTREGTLKYYISAANKRNQTFTMPGIAPEKYYSVTWGDDQTAPTLHHEPVDFLSADSLAQGLTVYAHDNLGVNTVKVSYIVNNREPQELTLSWMKDSTYQGEMTFPKGTIADGDSVRYRIEVEDLSANKNKSFLPAETEYYKFFIEGTYEPVEEYSADFNTANRDFMSSDFSISTPDNFDDGALHSIHPYASAEKQDVTYNYTAQLKYPIIIKDGGIISYDEVVLVEPATLGAIFGSDEFWDYVIVEGSADNGKTWLPLIDGYDSGANTSWSTAYNNSISGNNSTTAGTADMYIKKEFPINGAGYFDVGDIILIRFRLFSDPYGNGWGWCIDNLSIQDPVSSSPSLAYSPGELIFYPNPVTDQLLLKGNFTTETNRIRLVLLNNQGQLVKQEILNVEGKTIQKSIAMNNFPPGLYFVTVVFENGQQISRKIVKK